MGDKDASAPSDEQMRKLSEALAGMRDALVEASLSLKDARLELDARQRLEIQANCQELIGRIKANSR